MKLPVAQARALVAHALQRAGASPAMLNVAPAAPISSTARRLREPLAVLRRCSIGNTPQKDRNPDPDPEFASCVK